MRLLVSGASGLIGKNFIRQALRENHDVSALVRSPGSFKMLPEDKVFKWSHQNYISEEALKKSDAVIHLSGENIAEKYWSKDQKKRLLVSRVLGTKNLVESLACLPKEKRPKILISASAIGYYGYNRDGVLDETSNPGNDFLADLCKDWEQEALKAEKLGLRVILLRTGIVLSKEGGALTKMPPIQISGGKNWMSWIHVQDMAKIILFSLNNESISGPINCVSPNAVQNKEFVRDLAYFKRVPSFGFVPRPLLTVALGELSNALVSSLKVQPKKLQDSGFKFLYPNLKAALETELSGTTLFDKFLYKDQFVPLKPEEIFQFFSRAENLEILTPSWLNFKIISKSSDEIKKGTVIDYKLKIRGLPIGWKTLISDWKKNEYFIDEQTKGPYSKWHHVHTFEPVPGGCLLRDQVSYRIPVAILSNVILGRLISNDVNKIFNFRQEKIENLLKNGELK